MENIRHVEVVIHVDESLDDDRRAGMVKNLQARDGVEKARFTPGHEHLMVIDHDSEKLRSSDVLGLVREEKVGAELVGI
jgi:hypothetical protein